MMRAFCLFVAVVFLAWLSAFIRPNGYTSSQLLGTWNWVHMTDTEAEKVLSLSDMTMGLATKVQFEFKTDSIYFENKNKLNATSMISNSGKWYLDEQTGILYMSSKGKWNASQIIRLTADTMVLEMRKPLQLLLVREK